MAGQTAGSCVKKNQAGMCGQGCDQKVQKLSTEKILYTCNKLGLIYFRLMPNNNDLVNRPFADLQERLDNVQRQERSDVETINRKDMYRAIATYLDSEIYHLILNTNNPEIKAWGRRVLDRIAEMHKDIL
tara:strand:- start:167 stop:556 length:390 start_codon:yes stop_codon:yes gene_type:complete